jgi:ABC-type lipoprotein release transport system permease subunit
MITMASVVFGVSLVVFAVSLNEGAYAQLVDDAVRMQSGHLTFEHPDYRDAPAIDLVIDDVTSLRRHAEAVVGVSATKLLVLGQGMARSGSGSVGVAVIGVEPQAERISSPLARNIIVGEYLDATDQARVVVGSALAERLQLDVGKKLVLSSNDVSGGLVESLYRVKGIFRTGSDEIDGYVVQAPVSAVRELYGIGPEQATQLAVLIDDVDDQQRLLSQLAVLVDGSRNVVCRLQEVFPGLNAFIRLDRVSDSTFEGMLLVLILFTIFNTLLMSIVERERELSVLLALGTPPSFLRLQVLIEAGFIGAIGCGVGLLLGTAVALYFQSQGLDLSGVFGEGVTVSGLAMSPRIHAKVSAPLVATIGGAVFIAVVMLGALVVRRIGRTQLADVLR